MSKYNPTIKKILLKRYSNLLKKEKWFISELSIYVSFDINKLNKIFKKVQLKEITFLNIETDYHKLIEKVKQFMKNTEDIDKQLQLQNMIINNEKEIEKFTFKEMVKDKYDDDFNNIFKNIILLKIRIKILQNEEQLYKLGILSIIKELRIKKEELIKGKKQ